MTFIALWTQKLCLSEIEFIMDAKDIAESVYYRLSLMANLQVSLASCSVNYLKISQ